MNLIFLGPPGAGKRTQAELMVEAFAIPRISIEAILRTAVRDRTALGQQVKTYMDAGSLISDELVGEIVQERLKKDDCRTGYILDGFPRTIKQAQAFEGFLSEKYSAIDHVLLLEVEKGELIKRLSGRRICRQCGLEYHVIFNPPLNLNSCDKCRETLYQRDEDHQEAVRKRLDLYDAETFPLVQYYKEKNLIRSINGQGGLQQIFERIKFVLS